MTQSSIVESVRAELKRLGCGDEIQVRAQGGVVTLSGRVADAQARRMIRQEILRLPQVLDLRNELEPPAPAGDLATQVRALLARESVRIGDLTVAAEGGVVTLSGAAEGWFDRDAAERLAWTLPGVHEVRNEVRIPPDAVDPNAAERRA